MNYVVPVPKSYLPNILTDLSDKDIFFKIIEEFRLEELDGFAILE